MYNILCNRVRNSVRISVTTSSRVLSGLKSELDPNVKRIQRLKRFFAFSLFGITLTTALLVKNYKRRQWFELMAKTKRLQVLHQ
jgi:hypothetical protein